MSDVDAWRASLLPPNATAFETAEEKTDAARYPLDTDSIRRVKDANETPADILPVLAWERSVDVWWPGQSETSQRFITDKSFELHKQKGTRTGLKRHIELTGAKVLRIDAPPLMAFPGREWTDEERLAWLARFPQIRTFKYRNSGQVAGAMYASDDLWMNEKAPLIFADDPESPFAKFAVTVNGFEYHGYHSFLWDRGTETPLTTWERVVTEEDKTINIYDWIVLPGTINCRWFADQIPVGGVPGYVEESGFFCTDDPLADRTVSVFRDTEDYKDNNEFFTSRTISPSLRPIYIKPEKVFEQWSADRPADWFADVPNAMFFATDDLAAYHIYDRLYLHDRKRGPVPLPPELRCFADHTYYQFPVFTSLTKVQVDLTLPPFAFFQYCRGYWMDIDMAPYERVLAAARSASSARDSTLIQTRTRGTLTAGPGIKCGEIVCGQIGPI